MGEQIEFERVVQEFRGAFHEGQLKFHPSSFTFKNKKTNKSEQIQNNDINDLYWMKRAKGHCFKVVLKSGQTLRFDGFGENDYQKLEDYVSKNFKKSVEKTEMFIKGWNWGKPNFQGDSMNFEADGRSCFEIPLKNVSNTTAMKNEAVVQFHQNDDAQVSLMEIRFHIPSGPTDTENDSASDFVNSVLAKADIKQASEADAICALTELNCLTPRGRYDVKFFTDFLDLHGKTFDYKISYDHILRLFLLPHKDNRQMFFMMAMDPPIKQGQTRYPFLIFLFNIEEETSVEIKVSDKTKEKFGDRIEKHGSSTSGPYHEVVSRICRIVLDKKITVPGNFSTAAGAKCYPCSFKASSGFLYPLERGFVFVTKPPLHILFQDITFVKFDRSNQGTRSFDFEIETKAGVKYTFNGIEKTEQEKFAEFIKSKSITIAKGSDKGTGGKFKDKDEDDYDPYAERMKDEGRQKDEDDEDSDDDEDDEDFKADSESDDDIEYDSNASISSKSSGDEESGSDKEKGKKKSKSSDKKSSPPEKSKKSKDESEPKKRTSKDGSKSKSDKSKKSKNDSHNTSRNSDGKSAPKSAEFIEDSGDSD